MLAALEELIAYRGLIWTPVVRDLKVWYKGSVSGFLWSLLNPLFVMVVFAVLFTAGLPDNAIGECLVFVPCTLLPWNLFSASVMGSTPAIVANTRSRSRSTGA